MFKSETVLRNVDFVECRSAQMCGWCDLKKDELKVRFKGDSKSHLFQITPFDPPEAVQSRIN